MYVFIYKLYFVNIFVIFSGYVTSPPKTMGTLKQHEAHLWTIDDVKEWLEEEGFKQYVPLLCNKHRIDGKALLTLSENDLKSPPLSINASFIFLIK